MRVYVEDFRIDEKVKVNFEDEVVDEIDLAEGSVSLNRYSLNVFFDVLKAWKLFDVGLRLRIVDDDGKEIVGGKITKISGNESVVNVEFAEFDVERMYRNVVDYSTEYRGNSAVVFGDDEYETVGSFLYEYGPMAIKHVFLANGYGESVFDLESLEACLRESEEDGILVSVDIFKEGGADLISEIQKIAELTAIKIGVKGRKLFFFLLRKGVDEVLDVKFDLNDLKNVSVEIVEPGVNNFYIETDEGEIVDFDLFGEGYFEGGRVGFDSVVKFGNRMFSHTENAGFWYATRRAGRSVGERYILNTGWPRFRVSGVVVEEIAKVLFVGGVVEDSETKKKFFVEKVGRFSASGVYSVRLIEVGRLML